MSTEGERSPAPGQTTGTGRTGVGHDAPTGTPLSNDPTEILAFLELATPAAKLGYWQLDLATNALWWSSEVYRIHGLSPDDYTPDVDSAVDFYHPDDIASVRAMLARVIETSGRETFNLRLRLSNGETRHVRSAAMLRTDPDGGPGKVIGTFLETTYETLTSAVRTQLNALNDRVNLQPKERIEGLLEITRLIGDCETTAVWTNDDIDTPSFIVGAALGQDESVLLAEQVIGEGCKHQVRCQLYTRLQPHALNESQATLVDLILRKVGHDIVELRQSTELAAAREVLVLREQELAQIFATVPVPIWRKDKDNRITKVNPAAAQFMGDSVEAIESRNDTRRIPSTDYDYDQDDLDALTSRRPRLGVVERYIRPDGEPGWLRTDKTPCIDPESGETGLLVVAQDATAVMRTQREMEHQTRELIAANRNLDEFAYIASHDLRSPIRAISQLAHWIEEDNAETLTADSHKALSMLIRRANRMDQLLTDILTYARSGRDIDAVETVECQALVRQIVADLGISEGFTVSADATLPTLTTSRTALRHILQHLIANSIKHHDRDTGSVRVFATHTEESVIVHVADDGPGIEQQFQERIFRLLETLAPRDRVEGSGVGLAIARRLALALQGDISVTSNPGQRNTTFSLTLANSLLCDRSDVAEAV
ncbi:MAG: ATP-binding protein [Pseudomonadota bacterium]